MHTCTASSSMLLLFSLATGCVAGNEDSPVAILYNQQPGADCTISSSETGAAIIRGTIDTTSPAGYLLTPVVKNFAETSDFINVGQRIAYLEGAVIRVNQGGSSLADFTTTFGAVVEPDGGSTGLLFELVPQQIIEGLRGSLGPDQRTTLNTTTELFGSLGGSSLETKQFSYTIDVCNGCLINDVGPCSTFSGEVNNEGGKCNPLQDTSLVDCCTEGGALVCPALTTSSTVR